MTRQAHPSTRRLEAAADQLAGAARRTRGRRGARGVGREGEGRAGEAARMVETVERWQEVDAARTVFLDVAAHELRTPVTVLAGYLSMLQEGSFGPLPPSADDVVRLLTAKTEELNRLVDDILDVVRLDAVHVGTEPARCDVGDEVATVVEEWQPLVRRGQELRMVRPRSPVVAPVEGARVRTIVTNLVTNAIKYTPRGDIEVSVGSTPRDALVTVRDEGLGISAEEADTAFARFGRVRSSAGEPGSGLGLHIARELARLNGGDITLAPTAGTGSTFVVNIPLTRAVFA